MSVAIELPTESSSPPHGGFLTASPKWGSHSSANSAMVCASEANASITHTTQPRPMTTQTQATDQALTDEQLEALNGAGPVSTFFWVVDNFMGFGIPMVIDESTGFNVKHAIKKSVI